tara:strand:+ start:2643 stop:3398 length:756 start_codon:yes stop_codon:yes gene_type:complete
MNIVDAKKNIVMKNIIFVGFLFSALIGKTQFNLESIKDKSKSVVSSVKKTSLSDDEIIQGLKEALNVGIEKAGAKASQAGGFNNNQIIRIPFPEEAKKMEDKLRYIGMGSQIDTFENALNRAAEKAAKEAAPVFIAAIKSMNVNDGLSILKGEDDAATKYLNKTTSDSLYKAFKPIIQKALKSVKVTQYWNPLVSRYNKIPLTTKVNPDLEDYTTKKAIEGLFKLLAKEEKAIRSQPSARVTDLLKKVFSE